MKKQNWPKLQDSWNFQKKKKILALFNYDFVIEVILKLSFTVPIGIIKQNE